MSRTLALSTLAIAIGLGLLPTSPAADPKPDGKEYLAFIKKQAAELRKNDKPPATLGEWQKQRKELRANLIAALGGLPEEKCPLDPKNHGELKRDGYRIEKITFQTRPGIRMTANAYVPDRKGKHPAILMVHGHWRGAKQDPVVQARCIGAAKLGFFVLCVDAFGAGERGIDTKLGEYHGEMVAATLLPSGLTLAGLQVWENMRAVDYLLTRSEVDGDRIGITGASGGGNQTMYAGALDERFKAVVPVCSVGNYQAYLGAACCMCEIVPGALTFTEESGVLSLVAPRALMVINATMDAFQFSVGEARKSIAAATPVFHLYDKPANIRHTIFESRHDYSKPMREAMYGWMALHLKGEGDGSPIPEPEIKTEDPETLRCFPGDTRPKDWVTLPQFAAAEGKKALERRPAYRGAKAGIEARRRRLREQVLGGFPDVKPAKTAIPFESEPGIVLRPRVEPGNAGIRPHPVVILLNLEGAERAASSDLASAVRKEGWTLITLDLRVTGSLALPTHRIGRAPDHNSAQWGLWIGRPLLGQWTFDARRLIDLVVRDEKKLPKDIIAIGEGPAGLVALCAAATDPRITKVAAVGTLASFISDVPYEGQRLGVIAPGILRDVGDVADIAALAAPRRVVVAGGVHGNGEVLMGEELRKVYGSAAGAWESLKSKEKLIIEEKTDAIAVIRALK
jgi:cephalosporin-C deacetylase-like acetyl esterase